MYAVIQTGGKQYRVQPGDLLVVEKLEGQPGQDVMFDRVLMLGGEGGQTTVGAPVVEGAVVRATLVETRKGEKVKIVKKIRRQGYRRTKGHRQLESVLRVTGLEGAGVNARWDGEVDLTPRSVLVARARGLAGTQTGAADLPATLQDAQAGEVAFQEAALEQAAPKRARGKTAELPATLEDAQAGEVALQEAALAGEAQAGAEAAPKKPRARKPKADAAPEDGADQGGEA